MLGKARTPRHRHLARDPQLRGDLSVLAPVGGRQHDRERNANACALVRRRDHAYNCARSDSVNTMATATLAGMTTMFPLPPI
jgi:hypothetical protein